ncbi:hypothetical protein [Krasilnikovia sp. MM14-A1259]|uniref:hypothetical protein n=1 Tax=Krasilnikovia sp. MM14-A1259 TaxID=3373539 RepID=UPI00381E5B2F
MWNRPSRRSAALLTSAALAITLLAGCGGDNVDCSVNSCTVTLERSTEASASVLGVEAHFVRADGGTVTLEVAGEQIQLTTGQPAVQVAGLQVSLDSVTKDAVRVQISR